MWIQVLHLIATLACLPCLAPSIPAQASWVWWEGEAALTDHFPNQTWLSGARLPKRAELSAGDWLTYSQKRGKEQPTARWDIQVPSDGDWGLWCRKFWKHGAFRWRFDESEWRICGRDISLLDSVPLQKHVVANWVNLGRQTLSKGKHRFAIELLGSEGQQITAAMDCFVISKNPFDPRGALKPGTKSGRTEPGHWAFEPDPDGVSSALDLRFLNEPIAGAKGWVRRKGRALQRGDGRAIRFWGVNLGIETLSQPEAEQRRLARFLARRGVNLVRVHGSFLLPDQIEAIDPVRLAALQAFVRSCKAEGIYVALSFYFPLWIELGKEQGWPEYEGRDERRPFGLLFMEERYQKVHRAWLRALLSTPGADGAKPLSMEPALAIVEIQNEDSLLFWTFKPDTVPPTLWRNWESRFGAWILQRHGSFDKAWQTWGGARRKQDDARKKRMTMLPPYHFTGKGRSGALGKRMSDQLRFLVGIQRRFYEDTVSWMRKELGVKSLISCGNWHTAEAKTLQPLERWTYAPGDLIDAHGYFGGRHEGEAASYAIRVGDQFASRSALADPTRLPLLQAQYADRPFWMSEIGWPGPNDYKVEFPFLAATLASRQGMSGLCLFSLNGSGRWEGSAHKFGLALPSLLGQFPGFALLYRRGDLPTPKPALVEDLSLEKLFEFRGSLLARRPALDELRKLGIDLGPAPTAKSLPAQWLGPVLWKIVNKAGPIHNRQGLGYDENRFLDPESGDALSMDSKRGVLLLDTTRAQGAVGFLGGSGLLELGDFGFECDNEFASLLAISLDGKALATSRRVLIQMGTREHPHGWKVIDGRIQDLGGPPMQVEHLRATLHLGNARQTWKATPLDASGHPGSSTEVRRKMSLPKDCLYLLLER